MNVSHPLERTRISARALQFLLDLWDLDAPQEELIRSGTIIDGASATFDRFVFPSLPGSFVSRLGRRPITPPYIGTCAQAVCEGIPATCPNISTETRFDAEWRRLYLDFGIQSVQSAPVFSFNGKALGTFVVASNEPRAAASVDKEMMGFGAYAMRTILRRAAT